MSGLGAAGELDGVAAVCPRDLGVLAAEAGWLVCSSGHRYPCPDGVPVLLVAEEEPTHAHVWTDLDAPELAEPERSATDPVDPYVQGMVGGTCGTLYHRVQLPRYPIPQLRLPEGDGRTFLDIGCNWGRWSIAAARKGYHVVGLDSSLQGVAAARRVTRELGASARFIVADARRLPFSDSSFDVVFSYSVLQHFSRKDAQRAFQEIGRVLKDSGQALIQMPNAYGPRSLYQQVRRGFRDGKPFLDVTYWRPATLRALAEASIGESKLEVDGFLTLNAQPTDLDLLPPYARAVVRLSDRLRGAAARLPWLLYVADSLYVRSEGRPARPDSANGDDDRR